MTNDVKRETLWRSDRFRAAKPFAGQIGFTSAADRRGGGKSPGLRRTQTAWQGRSRAREFGLGVLPAGTRPGRRLTGNTRRDASGASLAGEGRRGRPEQGVSARRGPRDVMWPIQRAQSTSWRGMR
jgi:hypothetical protein